MRTTSHPQQWHGAARAGIPAYKTEFTRLELRTARHHRCGLPTIGAMIRETGRPEPRDPGLTLRERRILDLMAGTIDGHRRSVEQVARRLGISEQRLVLILAAAKKKLT
jgi:DNA-binding CsgD family transcriptional regulator